MAGTALHYNLGVTYYKLQQYEKAREEFETLTKDPKSATLAHYNIGMVALAQGQKSAARRQFQMASRKAMDEKLRALADERLEELPGTPRLPEMSGFFSLSADKSGAGSPQQGSPGSSYIARHGRLHLVRTGVPARNPTGNIEVASSQGPGEAPENPGKR